MAEEKFDKKDLDKDGTVSKAEEKKYEKQKQEEKEDSRDKLEADLMASEYGWAADLIYSNDKLKDIFKEAIKEGWTATRFIAKFKDTNFYQNHTESWLKAEALKQTKPLAYQEAKKGYAAKIRDDAANLGLQLSEKKARELSEKYVRLGFNAPERQSAYNDWLAKKIKNSPDDGFLGSAGEAEQELLSSLARNGFDVNSQTWKDWVGKTVRSLVAGDSKITDAQDYVRRQAASRYPSYADKMLAEGKDLQDYAQGYISMMSEVLEIPETDINVLDPKIKAAMMGDPDDKGVSTPKTLFNFEKDLRQDSRWRYTKNANETAQNTANYLLKSFGFLG